MEQQIKELRQQYFSVNDKKRILIAGLIVAVILAILWSLNVGPAKVDLATIWKVLKDLFGETPEIVVVSEPRYFKNFVNVFNE